MTDWTVKRVLVASSVEKLTIASNKRVYLHLFNSVQNKTKEMFGDVGSWPDKKKYRKTTWPEHMS
jgi:hypothetical protein